MFYPSIFFPTDRLKAESYMWLFKSPLAVGRDILCRPPLQAEQLFYVPWLAVASMRWCAIWLMRLCIPRFQRIVLCTLSNRPTYIWNTYLKDIYAFLSAHIAVFATATCPSVRHSRHCIKTTKPILKLFRPPSGSPVIEAFGTPCTDTQVQGEPLHRGC